VSRRRRVLARLLPPLAGMGVAATLTVALTLAPTSAAFTAQTGDTGNQVTTATTFCASAGTGPPPLAVVNDSAIYEVNPGANYSTTAIGVGTGATGDAYTLLKFTIPSPPPGCTVASAMLYVYVRTPSAPAKINAHRATVTWTNANTWSTLPRPAPGVTAVEADTAAGWVSWQVKTLVQELLVGPDYGFLLKDSVDHHPTLTRYQTFESSESYPTRAPYLVLTWG
jgi:hypothetical protein